MYVLYVRSGYYILLYQSNFKFNGADLWSNWTCWGGRLLVCAANDRAEAAGWGGGRLKAARSGGRVVVAASRGDRVDVAAEKDGRVDLASEEEGWAVVTAGPAESDDPSLLSLSPGLNIIFTRRLTKLLACRRINRILRKRTDMNSGH